MENIKQIKVLIFYSITYNKKKKKTTIQKCIDQDKLLYNILNSNLLCNKKTECECVFCFSISVENNYDTHIPRVIITATIIIDSN